MSNAAPTPFSAFGTKKPESSSGGAAFPPMSAAAPKPFGAAASAKEEKKTTTAPSSSSAAAAAFPPMSSAAPKPFSASSSSVASVSVKSYLASSTWEKQLWGQVARFSKITSDTKRLSSNLKTSVVSAAFGSQIEEGSFHCQENLSHAENISGQHSEYRDLLVHLLSIQDDLRRQCEQSLGALTDRSSKKSLTATARKEPLDSGSQYKRQKILSKSHKVQYLLETTKQSLLLNKDMFSFPPNQRQAILRPSEYFNQLSSPQLPARRQSSQAANSIVFKSLTGQYERARNVLSLSESLQQAVDRLSSSTPRRARSLQTPDSRAKKVIAFTSNRKSISPLPTKHLGPMLSSKPEQSKSTSITDRHALLRSIAGDLSHRDKGPKSFHLANRMMTSSDSIPDWKSKGKCELMPSSRKQNCNTAGFSIASPVVKTLFSSPIAQSQTRQQWNTQTSATTSMLQVNMPSSLKEISASDAAKSALCKFQLSCCSTLFLFIHVTCH